MSDERKSFAVNDGKGFKIRFPNGLVLSTQFGVGNYCENRNGNLDAERSSRYVQSNTCEIAVWRDGDEEWMTKEVLGAGDDVIGFVEVTEWLASFEKVKSWDGGAA